MLCIDSMQTTRPWLLFQHMNIPHSYVILSNLSWYTTILKVNMCLPALLNKPWQHDKISLHVFGNTSQKSSRWFTVDAWPCWRSWYSLAFFFSFTMLTMPLLVYTSTSTQKVLQKYIPIFIEHVELTIMHRCISHYDISIFPINVNVPTR